MTVLIGSANLSGGGLRANLEVSAVETTSSKSRLGIAVRRYFGRLEKTPGVDLATWPLIRIYQREHAIHRKHAVEAEKDAKREIAELDALQPVELKRWLARYSKDRAQQLELARRVRNYRAARAILNRLTEEKIGTAREFSPLYNRLVGGGGHSPLWASGGLSRARESVVEHFPEALAMFRALRDNLRRSPSVVFDVGLSHASGIPGMGPNVITEALTSWNARKYPVLNRNPVTSMSA